MAATRALWDRSLVFLLFSFFLPINEGFALPCTRMCCHSSKENGPVCQRIKPPKWNHLLYKSIYFKDWLLYGKLSNTAWTSLSWISILLFQEWFSGSSATCRNSITQLSFRKQSLPSLCIQYHFYFEGVGCVCVENTYSLADKIDRYIFQKKGRKFTRVSIFVRRKYSIKHS